MAKVENSLSGDTVGVYVADATILTAWQQAAKADDVSPSRWGRFAVEERLRRDGYLPESKQESDALSLLREAEAAGVNVRELIQEAMEGKGSNV